MHAATYSAPSAHVSFAAHDDRPILLLEDIEYFLSEVVCSTFKSTSSLAVRFVDEDVFDFAFNSWSQLDDGFVVLTAHYAGGCNHYSERGSWRYGSYLRFIYSWILIFPTLIL